MKKIIFFLVILVILSMSAQAKIVNKDLNIPIPNCYSVNISVELDNGDETPLGFVGCDKIDSENFYCECLNDDNKNFSLIMKTANTMVRDIRYYDIDISVKYFDVYRKTMSVYVEDGGEYYESKNNSWKERDNKVKYVKDIEYINVDRIVYKDKIVEVQKEVIVYQDKIVNNTIYVDKIEYIENTTQIEELEQLVKNKNYMYIIFLSGLIIIIFMVIYIKKENKK